VASFGSRVFEKADRHYFVAAETLETLRTKKPGNVSAELQNHQTNSYNSRKKVGNRHKPTIYIHLSMTGDGFCTHKAMVTWGW